MSHSFVELVDGIRDQLTTELIKLDAEAAYLKAPERLREVEESEPCVQRFVDFEFDPPKGQPAGRGPRVYGDPVAEALRKPLAEMDNAGREWMRDTVTAAIAMGYLFFCAWQSGGDPPSPKPGGDPRELWERWMLRLASDALDKALPKAGAARLLEIPGSHFENVMKKHEIYKLRNAGKIKQLSELYARAGATLRLFQSTTEFDIEPHRSQRKALPEWPFDRPGTVAG